MGGGASAINPVHSPRASLVFIEDERGTFKSSVIDGTLQPYSKLKKNDYFGFKKLTKRKSKKSSATRLLIRTALKRNFIFESLPSQHLEDIVDAFSRVVCPKDKEIIKEGTTGDYMYVIESGSFEIFKKNHHSHQDHNTGFIGTCGKGDSLGELSLLYGEKRSATAKCTEVALVWALDRHTFRYHRAHNIRSLDDIAIKTLSKMPSLKQLNKSQLTRAAGIARQVDYDRCVLIGQKDEISESFYIIMEGIIMCSKIPLCDDKEKSIFENKIKGKDVKVTDSQYMTISANAERLKAGDWFGENSLLGLPNTNNYVTDSNVRLLAIDRESFEKVLGSMQEILEQKSDKELLMRSPLVQQLPPYKRNEAVDLFTVETYSNLDIIAFRGDENAKFIYVKSGSVYVLLKPEDETIHELTSSSVSQSPQTGQTMIRSESRIGLFFSPSPSSSSSSSRAHNAFISPFSAPTNNFLSPISNNSFSMFSASNRTKSLLTSPMSNSLIRRAKRRLSITPTVASRFPTPTSSAAAAALPTTPPRSPVRPRAVSSPVSSTSSTPLHHKGFDKIQLTPLPAEMLFRLSIEQRPFSFDVLNDSEQVSPEKLSEEELIIAKKKNALQVLEPGQFVGAEEMIYATPMNCSVVAKDDNVKCFVLYLFDYLALSDDNENSLASKAHKKWMDPMNSRWATLEMVSCLGKGSFGVVHMVRDPNDQICYALKIHSLGKVAQEKIDEEVTILKCLKCDFICQLFGHTEDKDGSYLLMELVQGGGELKKLIYSKDPAKREQQLLEIRNGRLSGIPHEPAKFYIAGISLALAHLHKRSIVHRDLKPENIMIDRFGYPKLIDFGLAKRLDVTKGGKTYTFCGTAEYLAPEVILEIGHHQAVDWWALGVVLYELIVGTTPFQELGVKSKDQDQIELFENIVKSKKKYPKELDSNCRNMIDKLLTCKPLGRLGCGLTAHKEFQQHDWLVNIDWKKLKKREIMPPWVPSETDYLKSYHQRTVQHLLTSP